MRIVKKHTFYTTEHIFNVYIILYDGTHYILSGNWEPEAGGLGTMQGGQGQGVCGPLTFYIILNNRTHYILSGNWEQEVWEQCKEGRVRVWANDFVISISF